MKLTFDGGASASVYATEAATTIRIPNDLYAQAREDLGEALGVTLPENPPNGARNSDGRKNVAWVNAAGVMAPRVAVVSRRRGQKPAKPVLDVGTQLLAAVKALTAKLGG